MRKDEFCRNLSILLEDEEKIRDIVQDYFCGAVLIPLVWQDGDFSILFEVRSAKLTWQPGEICFPGGRIEREDKTPMDTAVRETSEELGIREDSVKLLGTMEPILSPIGVVLYPIVGYLPGDVKLTPNPAEVAEVFTVPLSHLLAAEPVVGHMEMATRPLPDFPHHLLNGYSGDWKKRKNYRVFFYQYQQKVIWGLTAQVLQQFLHICRSAI